MTQSPEAMRARAARRRHMQQRQTVIFGTLVAALLVIGLLGGAMWSGVIPTPVNIPIYSGEPAAAPSPVVPPCPPEGALPVPYDQLALNVFNGTEQTGLAATTAAQLRDLGIPTGTEANGPGYGGVVRVTTGPVGIASAYTVAALFVDSQIVLDAREDAGVDILIGTAYVELLPLDDVDLDPAVVIPAPADCAPITPEATE